MRKRFVDLAVAGVVLGIVQAVLESALLAWLYRDLLVAPYRFFPTHAYDAFAKLWFALAQVIPLPMLLADFLGQGVAPKLALAPELVAINIAVAMLVAAVLAPVAGVFGIGARSGPARAVAVVAGVGVLVHLAVWAMAFHPPESITVMKLARAVARDVLQGGAGLALVVLALAAPAAAALRPRVSSRRQPKPSRRLRQATTSSSFPSTAFAPTTSAPTATSVRPRPRSTRWPPAACSFATA